MSAIVDNPDMVHLSDSKKRWDIFCQVIDNYGDIGVCWRLACQLARRGQRVRLWVDETSALDWMAPDREPGVEVLHWCMSTQVADDPPGDILVEAFGCEIDGRFIASYARQLSASGQNCVWINLEYLSAERFVQRCHGLPSPVTYGPGKGLVKHFFYPGFTPGTGGLLRESGLIERRAAFNRVAWLAQFDTGCTEEHHSNSSVGHHRVVSLFCYEPAMIGAMLDTLAQDNTPTQLLVTAGRSKAVVQNVIESKNAINPNWNNGFKLSISYLPLLSQTDFDHLLWACDLNFVRGEDSLVRAIWSGQPFVWQIYPQDDAAHLPKLEAFLDWLGAPASLHQCMQAWNSNAPANATAGFLPLNKLPEWQQCTQLARARLLSQNDLVSQLLDFGQKTH
jgi:uncharacterized repeat protein (TIGR03837 family)